MIIEHLFNGTTHVPAASREIFKYNIGVRRPLAPGLVTSYMLRPTDSDLGSPAASIEAELRLLPRDHSACLEESTFGRCAFATKI